MISRTNSVLAGMLAVVLILAAWTRVDYSQPNYEILPDMKYTAAATTFASNQAFKNGRTLQAPVPGSIARGHLPLHYQATKEDAVRAGDELRNPYHQHVGGDSADSEAGAQQQVMQSAQRGSHVFRVMCIPCHGARGIGDGIVATRGFPPPPSLLTGKSLEMRDGQLFHIVSYGQGNMSGFSGQLSPPSRWDVINYVRSLQQSSSQSVLNSTMDASATANRQEDETESDSNIQVNTQGDQNGP